jgi:hypothetical protein
MKYLLFSYLRFLHQCFVHSFVCPFYLVQKIGSKFVVFPPTRRQQRRHKRHDSDSDDLFNSDYEDELDGLTGLEDDPTDQQHPTSDINLMHLVQVN